MKVIAAVLVSALTVAAQSSDLPLMPMPEKIAVGQGRFAINEAFHIGSSGRTNARVEQAAARITRRIAAKTGLPIDGQTGAPAGTATELQTGYGPLPEARRR